MYALLRKIISFVYFCVWIAYPGSAETLRDIQGPVAYPKSFPLLASLLTLLAVIVISVLLLYYLRKRSKKLTTAHPWEVALKELHVLQTSNYVEQAMHKKYYEVLSLIFRKYMHHRFAIPVLEKTRDEFLHMLRGFDKITQQQKESIINFSNLCEQVKFAHYIPNNQQLHDSVDFLKRFIEDTKIDMSQERRNGV